MVAVRTILLFLGMAALPISAVAQVEPASSPCKGVANCNQHGTEALRKGDVPAAIRFFKAQVGYAEDAQDKTHSVVAYNNLSVAYLRKHDYFRALSWAHLALRIDPENKAAKSNLQKIEENTKNYKWPTDISGLYVRYSRRTQWDSLRVSEPRDSTVSFHLLAYRIGLAWRRYGPGSYGDVDGDAVLTGNREAVYKDADFPTCRITIHFKGDAIKIEQEGDCGFGYGVQATGDYERICSGGSQHCDEQHLP